MTRPYPQFVRIQQNILDEMHARGYSQTLTEAVIAAEEINRPQDVHLSDVMPALRWGSALYQVINGNQLELIKSLFDTSR